MYVKPAPGMQCRDPDLKDLLPPTGRDVPATHYWLCRLRDGDVVECGPAEAAATTNEEPIDTGSAKGKAKPAPAEKGQA